MNHVNAANIRRLHDYTRRAQLEQPVYSDPGDFNGRQWTMTVQGVHPLDKAFSFVNDRE